MQKKTRYSNYGHLEREARKIKKKTGCDHCEALEKAAVKGSFRSLREAQAHFGVLQERKEVAAAPKAAQGLPETSFEVEVDLTLRRNEPTADKPWSWTKVSDHSKTAPMLASRWAEALSSLLEDENAIPLHPDEMAPGGEYKVAGRATLTSSGEPRITYNNVRISKVGPVRAPALGALKEKIGLCGCGNPDRFLRVLRNALAYCGEESRERDFKELKKDPHGPHKDDAYYFVHSMLDAWNLTEHGGSVYSQWLSDEGEKVLGELIAMDLDSDSFDYDTYVEEWSPSEYPYWENPPQVPAFMRGHNHVSMVMGFETRVGMAGKAPFSYEGAPTDWVNPGSILFGDPFDASSISHHERPEEDHEKLAFLHSLGT